VHNVMTRPCRHTAIQSQICHQWHVFPGKQYK
jgi:hypothetical protein